MNALKTKWKMKKLIIIASLLLLYSFIKANDVCNILVQTEEGYVLNQSDTISVRYKLQCPWDDCTYNLALSPGKYAYVNKKNENVFFIISKDCDVIITTPLLHNFQIIEP